MRAWRAPPALEPVGGRLRAGARGRAESLVPLGREEFQSQKYLQDRGRLAARAAQSVTSAQEGCLSPGRRGRTVHGWWAGGGPPEALPGGRGLGVGLAAAPEVGALVVVGRGPREGVPRPWESILGVLRGPVVVHGERGSAGGPPGQGKAW